MRERGGRGRRNERRRVEVSSEEKGKKGWEGEGEERKSENFHLRGRNHREGVSMGGRLGRLKE